MYLEPVILRQKGRITIPKRVLGQMKLKPGAVLELSAEGDRIVLQVLKK